MRCANTARGCQWTGIVGTLDKHIVSCQFSLVPCPNKCKEDKGAGELLLFRKNLDQHLKSKCPKRVYKCPNCGEKGTFASIKKEHDQLCQKKIVACPNKKTGCSLSMERGKTKEHVSSDCEYAEVACVCESLGCGVRMLRKDKATHENEAREKHMDLSLANVKLLSIEQKSLIATVELSEEKHKSLEKFIALKDTQHKSLTEEHNKLSKKHETLSKKHETLLEQHKMLSDTVGSHKEQYKVQTRKEKFIFKLPHYTSKKEMNMEFFSLPFFTHPGGYKMCIRIDANGNGDDKGTHVSAFTNVLAGQYDYQLQWPFLGTVTYELLNQLEDNNHHRMEVMHNASHDMRANSTCYGYSKFIPHSSLSHNPAINTQYLLDDTLYFRVSVKVDNHKPWLVCTQP